MKAIWKDVVIAESDATVIVEGNHYFPPAAIRAEHFQPSDTHTVCPWKGTASYYDVVVNGEVNNSLPNANEMSPTREATNSSSGDPSSFASSLSVCGRAPLSSSMHRSTIARSCVASGPELCGGQRRTCDHLIQWRRV